jgi:hypothetical protein
LTEPAVVLDHLVVAAYTLDQGVSFVQDRLGVPMAGGGKHAAMGTHNRVLKLGPRQYLEVIAIDPKGRRPDFPRWFNLDDSALQAQLKIHPRLITWVVRTDNLDSLVKTVYGLWGCIRTMQRGALRWRFACTDDGSMPGGGLIPHMMQWEGSGHPVEAMPESGCTLVGLDGVHTEPAFVQRVVSSLGLNRYISIRPVAEQRLPGLVARIKTCAGVVKIDML